MGNFIKCIMPIMRDNKNIGSVEVYVTNRFMQKEFKRQMTYTLITALTLILVIFLLSFLILKKVIINPIAKLTYAADKVSMGQMNAKIDISSDHEIGLPARTFDRMQASLNLALKHL